MDIKHAMSWGVFHIVGLAVVAAGSAVAQQGTGLDSALDLGISEFNCGGADLRMFQIVNQISVVTGVPTLFIQAEGPQRERLIPKSFQINRQNTTARKLLDEAVLLDPLYVWFPAKSFVNVVPAAMLNDPGSIINQTMPKNVSFENIPLGEAVQRLIEAVPAGKPLCTGFVCRFPGYPTSEILDRKIHVTTKAGITYLDAINAIADAGGQDIIWTTDNPEGPLWIGKNYPSRVRTTDLAAAEKFITGKAAPDWSKAVAFYEKALASCPYPSLATKIQFAMAQLYLGNAGPLADVFPHVEPRNDVAIPMLEEIQAQRALAADANVFVEVVDVLTSANVRAGQLPKAKGNVDTLLDSKDIGAFYRTDHLCQLRIDLEVDARDERGSVERLKTLRAKRVADAVFQQELEKVITRAESKLANSKANDAEQLLVDGLMK